MPGVDPNTAFHCLHVDPSFKPIKQKKRNVSDKNNLPIQMEVEDLIRSHAIREMKFPEWISNVVLVKKSNNKWRMCTDFINNNKAYPKDYYPLPCLGRLVNGGAGLRCSICWMLPGNTTKF
ncbi:hypothetical protein LIER_25795 [Lithospermum erythrorhizon]|uniref:Uncharacterized protein n=1 Tax=Lithospermum erythrorhizon TaxID=34254 RepID=A0AAV3R949_LITER